MNRFVLVCVAGLVLALTACAASVPMAPKTLDAEAKEFSLPPPDRAKIYVYRDQTMGFALETYLGLDDRYRSARSARKPTLCWRLSWRAHAYLQGERRGHAAVSPRRRREQLLRLAKTGGGPQRAGDEVASDRTKTWGSGAWRDANLSTCRRRSCRLRFLPASPAAKRRHPTLRCHRLSGSKDVPAPSKMLAVFEFQAKDLEEDVLNTLSDEVRAGVVKGLRGRGVGVMTHESMLASIKDKGKGDCAEGACEVGNRPQHQRRLPGRGEARARRTELFGYPKLLETRGGSLLGTENVQAASLIALKHALADKARALVADRWARVRHENEAFLGPAVDMHPFEVSAGARSNLATLG